MAVHSFLQTIYMSIMYCDPGQFGIHGLIIQTFPSQMITFFVCFSPVQLLETTSLTLILIVCKLFLCLDNLENNYFITSLVINSEILQKRVIPSLF